MPSAFVDHLIKPLELSQKLQDASFNAETLTTEGGIGEQLQSLLCSLIRPLSESLVVDTVGVLTQIELRRADVSVAAADSEDDVLKDAIISKLLVGLYAEGIDSYLSQATEAETEAEWWADIERSRWSIASYLLQTTPLRLLNLTREVIRALRVRNLPVALSSFTPSSLRNLFPTTGPRQLNTLHEALFPHLRRQPLSVTPSTTLLSSFTTTRGYSGRILTSCWGTLEPLFALTRLPVELVRQECAFKRRELEKVRDQRAEALGYMANMRNDLSLAIQEPTDASSYTHILASIANGDAVKAFSPSTSHTGPSREHRLNELLALSTAIFKTQKMEYRRLMESQDLFRPSRLTLIWPRLLFLPPLCIYALRSVYSSRASLAELAIDAKATAEGFVKGWLLDPLKDVVKTVRAGSEDGVIVQKEGIAADLASLERMTLSLAKDQLNYNDEQLANLSKQIRLGDLTPVLQIYEEDIRRPLKSAVTGNLLRSVFIQVQKAKVDIDQTLSGIDKLLKSQELTFAFVGVAPAFGIVYLLGGTLLALLAGGRGVGKYGGKQNIRGVWSAMRYYMLGPTRTERLLVAQPKRRHHKNNETSGADTNSIPPLTSGLLLLSVARLRTFAEKHLPLRSRLREGFLEDVGDLENPDLGRDDKMKVIERMWRCWGTTLGWGSVAVEGTSRS
ncbi:hypothetical protein DXG01_006767 [Tephrocybe rancida]|nr:hypothetical protein DXG01_006767 [Tephrocybe rancida]